MRIARSKMPQQPVEIAEIAQATAEFAFGEKMGGAVQHHIGGGEHGDAGQGCDRDRGIAQAPAVDGEARGRRHDGVMHIDRRLSPLMLQRRQLMHPIAIIALVVVVGFGRVPPGLHQQPLGLLEPLAREQNIDIAEQPPCRGRQAGGGVSGALQEDDRHAERRQRVGDRADLARDIDAVLLRQDARGLEMRARRVRHLRQHVAGAKLRLDARQEPGMPRLPDREIPIGIAPFDELGRLPQQRRQPVARRQLAARRVCGCPLVMNERLVIAN